VAGTNGLANVNGTAAAASPWTTQHRAIPRGSDGVRKSSSGKDERKQGDG